MRKLFTVLGLSACAAIFGPFLFVGCGNTTTVAAPTHEEPKVQETYVDATGRFSVQRFDMPTVPDVYVYTDKVHGCQFVTKANRDENTLTLIPNTCNAKPE